MSKIQAKTKQTTSISLANYEQIYLAPCTHISDRQKPDREQFMAKRTKFSKFRDLYEVIEELAVSYTYEGVVEILAERHDLILTTGTLTNYLYRYKKQLKELSVATDNSNNEIEIKHDFTEQNLIKSQCSAPIQESDTEVDDDSKSDNQDDEEIDYDALLEKMKRKLAIKSNKSLLDR